MKRLLTAALAVLAMAIACPALATGPLKTADYSGTITTGGTFQTININVRIRRSLEFQNVCHVSGNCTSVSNSCFVYFGSGSPTTANSIALQAGQGYLRSSGVVPNDDVKVTCTGTGDKFVLKVQY